MTKRRYDRWTPERTARAAFLAGAGMSHVEIAADYAIKSSADAVAKMLSRVGLGAVGPLGGDYVARLPPSLTAAFAEAGRVRQMTTDKVFREIVWTLAGDKSLIDAILDDGVTT
jgi:hypothetical protein